MKIEIWNCNFNNLHRFNMMIDDAHLRYFVLWLECVATPPAPVFRAVIGGGGWLEDGFGLLRFLLFSSIVSSKLPTECNDTNKLRSLKSFK